MIPEGDRRRYGHMPARLYWEMLEGEDPGDRAVREAHGISYASPVEGMCRNGCGLTYEEISVGKIRECRAAGRVFFLAAVCDGRLYVAPIGSRPDLGGEAWVDAGPAPDEIAHLCPG